MCNDISDWTICNKDNEPERIVGSIIKKIISKDIVIARILGSPNPLSHAPHFNDYYIGFICSENNSSLWDAIWKTEEDSFEIAKLKTDLKLIEMGYNINKLGV